MTGKKILLDFPSTKDIIMNSGYGVLCVKSTL